MGKPRSKVIDLDWQQPALFTLFGFALATMPQLLVSVVLLAITIIVIKAVSIGRI